MEEITACPHCYCMTKTVKGMCGKCYNRKGSNMKRFRLEFSKMYSVVIEAEDENHAEEIFDDGAYDSRAEYADTVVTGVEEVEE